MTGSRVRITPVSAHQCARCGGVGTHYLTCPRLRLPAGYRLSQAPRPERAGHRGQHGITRLPAADGPGSAGTYR